MGDSPTCFASTSSHSCYHSLAGPHTVHHANGHGEGPAGQSDKYAIDPGKHAGAQVMKQLCQAFILHFLRVWHRRTHTTILSTKKEDVFKHPRLALTFASRGPGAK